MIGPLGCVAKIDRLCVYVQKRHHYLLYHKLLEMDGDEAFCKCNTVRLEQQMQMKDKNKEAHNMISAFL
jgi:hypothetical protein